MSASVIGALIGLGLGAVSLAALRLLATRVELDETKRVLRVTGLVDLVLFPVIGWFAGTVVFGD